MRAINVEPDNLASLQVRAGASSRVSKEEKLAKSALDSFHSYCRLRGMSSTRDYICYSRQFSEFLSSRESSIETCSQEDLVEYLRYLKEERKVKKATIKRAFTVLGLLFVYLDDSGLVEKNPIPQFKRLYLREYKEGSDSETRQVISLDQVRLLLSRILDSRDRAIAILLFKTGIRLGELVSLDLKDVDLSKGWLTLKHKAKRSNREIPLDEETIRAIKNYLPTRKARANKGERALFLSRRGNRLSAEAARKKFKQYAEAIGVHHPNSALLGDHFTPHCCRHVWTTEAIRSSMPRDMIKEIRGDVRKDAMDLYNHISKEELRESYLAHIPQLGT
jgi:integrase/recombinase XerD